MGHGNAGGYEKRDVNLGVLGTAIGIITVLLVGAVIVVGQAYDFAVERTIYKAQLEPASLELEQYDKEMSSKLNSYEMVDEKKDKYRIPIDMAMEKMATDAYMEKK